MESLIAIYVVGIIVMICISMTRETADFVILAPVWPLVYILKIWMMLRNNL